VTPAEREAAILSLRPQVEYLAGRRALHQLSTTREELISAGWIGAISAVDLFDQERGLLLETYADWKIRSAILDYLRGVDPLSRQHRQAVKAGKTPPVIVFSTDAPLHRRKSAGDRSLHFNAEDGNALRPIADFHARHDCAALASRARLHPRNLSMVRRYFIGGETMLAIARSEGLVESRISQIVSRSLRELRAAA
jgi:RNA polymerase sigma factor (sigma-70 family)